MQRPARNEPPAAQAIAQRGTLISYSPSLLPTTSSRENANLRVDLQGDGRRPGDSLPTPPPSASSPYIQYARAANAGPSRPWQDLVPYESGFTVVTGNQMRKLEAATRHLQQFEALQRQGSQHQGHSQQHQQQQQHPGHHQQRQHPGHHPQQNPPQYDLEANALIQGRPQRTHTAPAGQSLAPSGVVPPYLSNWPAKSASPQILSNENPLTRRTSVANVFSSSVRASPGDNSKTPPQPQPTVDRPADASFQNSDPASHARALLSPIRSYIHERVDYALSSVEANFVRDFACIHERWSARERQLLADIQRLSESQRQPRGGTSADAVELDAMREECATLRESYVKIAGELKAAREAQTRAHDDVVTLYKSCYALREASAKAREEKLAVQEENWVLKQEIAKLATGVDVQSAGEPGAQERSALVASVLPKVQQELMRRSQAAKEVAFLEEVMKEIAPDEAPAKQSDSREVSEDPVSQLLAKASPIVLSRLTRLSTTLSDQSTQPSPISASPKAETEAIKAVADAPNAIAEAPKKEVFGDALDATHMVVPVAAKTKSAEPALPPPASRQEPARPPSPVPEVIDLSELLDSPPRRHLSLAVMHLQPVSSKQQTNVIPARHTNAPLPQPEPSVEDAVVKMEVDRPEKMEVDEPEKKREREISPEAAEHPAKRQRTSRLRSPPGSVHLEQEASSVSLEPTVSSRSSEDFLGPVMAEVTPAPDDHKRLQSAQSSSNMSISDASEAAVEDSKDAAGKSAPLNVEHGQVPEDGEITEDDRKSDLGTQDQKSTVRGLKELIVDPQMHLFQIPVPAFVPPLKAMVFKPTTFKEREAPSLFKRQPLGNTNSQPGQSSRPQRPSLPKQLSLRHMPLMYRETTSEMVCRMCQSRKEVRDSKISVSKFPKSAKWDVLKGHCEEAHPKGVEALVAMSPDEVEEAKLNMGPK